MCNHDHHEATEIVDKETRDMLSRRRLVQALAAGGAIVATPALTGCATNPITGASQFVALASNAELNQMAVASWAEAKTKQKLTTDPRYLNRLSDIGSRISRGANKANENWDYAVFDSKQKNAFVLPGNRVGFYKGMMDFADNNDQIAAIMGHEVGHVTGAHARERVSQQRGVQGVTMAGTVIGASQFGKKCKTTSRSQAEYNNCMRGASQKTAMLTQALGVGFMVGLILPYSRRHETESDLLGARYMEKSGYNPYQAVKLWEKMAATSTNNTPEFLSTHPKPRKRAETLHNYIKCQERLGSQGWSDDTLKATLKACEA